MIDDLLERIYDRMTIFFEWLGNVSSYLGKFFWIIWIILSFLVGPAFIVIGVLFISMGAWSALVMIALGIVITPGLPYLSIGAYLDTH